MSVLVCGGAGYIGSHTVKMLIEKNVDVIVVDNLSQGFEKAVLGAKLYIGDVRDFNFMSTVFKNHPDIDSVIDFAASIEVSQSMKDPLAFYDNNLYSALQLIKTMNQFKVQNIVFSSTAAVYGDPEKMPIDENDSKKPTNPYGNSKLAVEQMLAWCENAYNIKSVCLRYFNACGADLSGKIGESHRIESHLIPLVLQVALKKREHIVVFGNKYNTADGTCVRDYVHVNDLAQAHILAMEYLKMGNSSDVFNLGSGTGFSVMEIIEHAKKITGEEIPFQIGNNRPGDPATLIASSEKIRKQLGWNPQFDNIDMIINSAWNWHKTHPNGF